MQTIQNFIRTNDVPDNLGQEITQHFDIINKQTSGDATSDNIDVFSMLSHSLQVEVARKISHALVQNCYVFENCDGNFIDSVCVLLREVGQKTSIEVKYQNPTVNLQHRAYIEILPIIPVSVISLESGMVCR